MLRESDLTFGSPIPFASNGGVQLRRIPIDDSWPAAPEVIERRVLDDWLPQRREAEVRLQAAIDAVESQLLLLDDDGVIVQVNRAWRLAAEVQNLRHPQHGLGVNYLHLCHSAAAEGCRDAAHAAEGIDAVLAGRWRSFHYKYAWSCRFERRLYLLRAWRFADDAALPVAASHVAVQHELLESYPITDNASAGEANFGEPLES